MDFFQSTFEGARTAFIQATRQHAAQLTSFEHPNRGPRGEALFVDVVRIGSTAARRVLLSVSGVHGIEGHAGSAVQIAHLARSFTDLPSDIAVVHVHAINPWGMAWCRRECEDNTDLFRNLSAHRPPFPPNEEYTSLDAYINPMTWNDSEHERSEARLEGIVRDLGVARFARIVRRGQHTHPRGVCFHGVRANWSTRTFLEIVREQLRDAELAVALDLHTGIGQAGDALIIVSSDVDSDESRFVTGAFRNVVHAGFDPHAVRHPFQPYDAPRSVVPHCAIHHVGVEFGTHDLAPITLLELMRADNWLHQHGVLDSPLGRRIKSEVREQFCPASPDWRAGVVEGGLAAIETALRALEAA